MTTVKDKDQNNVGHLRISDFPLVQPKEEEEKTGGPHCFETHKWLLKLHNIQVAIFVTLNEIFSQSREKRNDTPKKNIS